MTWVGKEQEIQLLSDIVVIKGYLQFERADEALKKLAALHLFVKTSPINKAVTSGKGNRLFTGYVNNLFPFPLVTALLIGDVLTNR